PASVSFLVVVSVFPHLCLSLFFFFHDPATPELYTLSLHDPLPISRGGRPWTPSAPWTPGRSAPTTPTPRRWGGGSANSTPIWPPSSASSKVGEGRPSSWSPSG